MTKDLLQAMEQTLRTGGGRRGPADVAVDGNAARIDVQFGKNLVGICGPVEIGMQAQGAGKPIGEMLDGHQSHHRRTVIVQCG
jgi:hypothetical protein